MELIFVDNKLYNKLQKNTLKKATFNMIDFFEKKIYNQKK